jgi:hypothetical protein
MLRLLLPVFLLIYSNSAFPSVSLADDETAEIYAAVVNRLVTGDDTYGGKLKPYRLYISREILADCVFPDPVPDSDKCPTQVAGTMPRAIEHQLSRLLATSRRKVVFVRNLTSLRRMKNSGKIVGGGVLISLSEIVQGTPDTVTLHGTIYIAYLAAGGTGYQFKKKNGHWVLTHSRMGWIS